MRAALADYYPADWFPTAQTGQERSPKYIQACLVVTTLAAGPLKIRLAIPQCCSHVPDAAAQNLGNGNMQAARFRGAERGGDAPGMQARGPERLVGIDIADTGQESLIQKQGL